MWRANCFDDLVIHYPQGSRDEIVSWFAFRGTTPASPNTCALRLSYALHAMSPRAMDGFDGNTWTTVRGVKLARGAQGLAHHIRRKSGWSMRHFEPRSGPNFTWSDYPLMDGQGIAFWKCSVGVNHIDLWDRDGHLAAANGRVMLWRPPPQRVTQVWYWQLHPPKTMIFGLQELGEVIEDNL